MVNSIYNGLRFEDLWLDVTWVCNARSGIGGGRRRLPRRV